MHEPTLVEMKDGRLALMTRPDGDICFSDDNGNTWTKPVSTGVPMDDPHLVQLPNGVLAAFHGSRTKSGLRVILSKDNGRTWNGPAKGLGYAVDSSVYRYSSPVVLDDGTVYVSDSENTLWAISLDACAPDELDLHRPADIDRDGIVNLADFAALANDWLDGNGVFDAEARYAPADVNRDCNVLIDDVAALVEEWLND